MLNFKKLFLGLLFSVLFSAVLIAVCAFMILKLGFCRPSLYSVRLRR